MSKKQVNKTAPTRFVPQLLGGIGGAFAGFTKARDSGKGIGKSLLGGLAGGAMGVANPVTGIASGVGAAAGKISDKITEKQADPAAATRAALTPPDPNIANSDLTNQAAMTNNAISNPGMVGAVADPYQDTYGSLFA